jgi:hypothetical protein
MAYTLHKDCLIDLLLAGADLHSFAAVPKAMRLDRVHETLATIEPSKDYTAEQLGSLVEDRLGEISEIIFIVLHWDRTYQQLVEWAEQAGCHCTAIVVGKPDSGRGNPPWLPETGAGTGACPYSDVRLVPADEILAGRRDSL